MSSYFSIVFSTIWLLISLTCPLKTPIKVTFAGTYLYFWLKFTFLLIHRWLPRKAQAWGEDSKSYSFAFKNEKMGVKQDFSQRAGFRSVANLLLISAFIILAIAKGSLFVDLWNVCVCVCVAFSTKIFVFYVKDVVLNYWW